MCILHQAAWMAQSLSGMAQPLVTQEILWHDALSNRPSMVDQVRRIEQQGGFVKGITWDPVGKFIAAQVFNA